MSPLLHKNIRKA